MATTLIPLANWPALDKTGWTHELIRKWNRRYGHMKRIPHVSNRVPILDERPSEARRIQKQRRKELAKPIWRAAVLDWDEVPTRLPYVFGDNPPTWCGTELDPAMVYVDASFLGMVERSLKVEQMKFKLIDLGKS